MPSCIEEFIDFEFQVKESNFEWKIYIPCYVKLLNTHKVIIEIKRKDEFKYVWKSGPIH